MGNSPSTQQPRPQYPVRPDPAVNPYGSAYPPPQVYQQQPQGQGGQYPPGGGYTNGQYYGGGGPGAYGSYQPQQQPQYPPYGPLPTPMRPTPQRQWQPQQPAPPPMIPPQEFQATTTIRNQVNLKKSSVKVSPVPAQPGQFSVSFSFDATAPCRVSVFVNAKDDPNKRNKLISPQEPLAVYQCDKGLDQKFPAAAAGSSAVATRPLPEALLREWKQMGEAWQTSACPIVIRLEALTDEGRAESRSLDAVEIGGEVPLWVQSQTTYARLLRQENGTWSASNVTQKIWVKGSLYELQEIYGMEPGRPVDVVDGFSEDVEGNECVICMSAPRDTTALPCRHMCMCHTCANELKTQTNKCPICRNVISSLLHIKIAPKDPTAGGAAAAAAAAAAAKPAPGLL